MIFKPFRIGDIFKIEHYGKQRSKDDLILGEPVYNFVMQSEQNNGVINKVPEQVGNGFNLAPGNSISVFTHLNKVYYQKEPFYSKQGSNVYTLTSNALTKDNALYFVSAINRVIGKVEYGKNTASRLTDYFIILPIVGGELAFDYMEVYIKELEAERVKELEAYLVATGLNDYVLTDEEYKVLADFPKWRAWYSFNVKGLFGKSVRGKRLKSADRLLGKLPFVTAGETNQGISAFVGNDVQRFKRNTITIDMFGSAKYRNYEYGGDDHIAVVNTESLPKYASLFVTTALNKSAHTGKFDYSRNFYAKDADELQIMLPITSNQKPDYDVMSCYIRAIEKLVIKGVVDWKDKQIEATREVVDSD